MCSRADPAPSCDSEFSFFFQVVFVMYSAHQHCCSHRHWGLFLFPVFPLSGFVCWVGLITCKLTYCSDVFWSRQAWGFLHPLSKNLSLIPTKILSDACCGRDSCHQECVWKQSACLGIVAQWNNESKRVLTARYCILKPFQKILTWKKQPESKME